MDSGTPKPTERSEGGRNKTKRLPILTEQVVVRFSKAEMMELEEEATAREWTLSQTIRARCRRGAQTVQTETREAFEESP